MPQQESIGIRLSQSCAKRGFFKSLVYLLVAEFVHGPAYVVLETQDAKCLRRSLAAELGAWSVRMQIFILRSDQGSGSGRTAIRIFRARACAANSGKIPTPSPDSTILQTAAELRTSIRNWSVR